MSSRNNPQELTPKIKTKNNPQNMTTKKPPKNYRRIPSVYDQQKITTN